MFSAEIKINGSMVGHIYGHNISENGEPHSYHCRHYDVESGIVKEGTVLHNRDDGINILIARVLSEVVLGKENE